MGNGKKSGRNSESDSLAQNISSSDPSNFRWPIQCCLISKTIQRAKEATLENQNSPVQIRAYYFHIFLHLLLSSKANEQKARKILMCGLYCSLFGGVCTAFPHLTDTEGPVLVCFLSFLLFYEIECSRESRVVKNLEQVIKPHFCMSLDDIALLKLPSSNGY